MKPLNLLSEPGLIASRSNGDFYSVLALPAMRGQAPKSGEFAAKLLEEKPLRQSN